MKRKMAGFILSQVIAVSSLSVAAHVNASSLPETITDVKRAILMDIQSDGSYDYNQNSSVDVFDLIRYKSDALNENIQPPPPETTPLENFISDLCNKVLMISPEQTDSENIKTRLESGSSTAADIMKELLNRPEYTSRNLQDADYITMLYNSLLGRDPDEIGYSNWCNRIQYMSRDNVLRGFIGSGEFVKRCSDLAIQSGGITTTENRDVNNMLTYCVFNMYKSTCGKSLSPDELNSLTGDILNHNITLEIAALRVADSEEFKNNCADNSSYVTAVYNGLLQRGPSEEELSSGIRALESGSQYAWILRKIAVSEEFMDLYRSKDLGSYIARIGSNMRIGDTWYHIRPNGDMFTIEHRSPLENLLNKTSDIIQQHGSSVGDLYNYVRSTTRYKYIESTRTLEEIESIGWFSFAEYAMDNYYGVCYHLAAKMDILLDQAGYRCRIVHSTHGTGDHYWNQVYQDGQWVNYDLTNNYYAYDWDRIINAGSYIFLGYVRPEYR